MLTYKKVCAGFAAASFTAGLAAQTPQRDADAIQEIIVTATKRETSLQDVPFSIAAVTETQIRNSGASDIAELARNIPGLTITDLGPGQSQVSIRGISAGQVVRDQPGVKEQVGVYLDESPISIALFTPDLDLFDLQRFEILRGPQGTLFGAGSLSGTLRYITNQPQLGAFGATGEVSASDGSDTEFGGSVKAAVNVPFGDAAALRVAAYYNELAGFIDATQPSLSVRENADGGSKTGARVALLIRPTEDLSITPRIVYQKLETDGFPRIDFYNILGNPFTTSQPAVDLGERGQFTQLTEGIEDDFTLADLKLEYSFGPVALTAISSYTDREVIVTRDATSLTGSVTFDLGGTDSEVRISSPLIDTTRLHAFSQEVRVASTGADDAFQWVAGAFYQDLGRRYGQDLPTVGYDAITQRLIGTDSAANGSPPDNPFFSRLRYKFKQKAVFGEATYNFSSQWSLTGGLRWYDFEESRLLTFGGVFAVPQADVPGSVDSDGFTPRAILTFRATEDVSFSGQISKGFRLGGINDPLNAPICSAGDRTLYGSVFTSTWQDEEAVNYEFGAKTRFADGRVTFNASIYYSDIDDLQANVDAGSCSSRIVVNVPKAHALGVEAELFARPTDNWDFGFSTTFVQARIDSTVTGSGTTPIAGIRDGNRMPTAPEVQAAASVTYSWPWANSLRGYVNFTAQYVGSSYTQLADQQAPFGTIAPGAFINYGGSTLTSFTFPTELPSYDIGNLRFGVRADQWEAAVFLNNVWDERAFLSLDRERGSRARVGYLTNRPRTFGVTFRRSF